MSACIFVCVAKTVPGSVFIEPSLSMPIDIETCRIFVSVYSWFFSVYQLQIYLSFYSCFSMPPSLLCSIILFADVESL